MTTHASTLCLHNVVLTFIWMAARCIRAYTHTRPPAFPLLHSVRAGTRHDSHSHRPRPLQNISNSSCTNHPIIRCNTWRRKSHQTHVASSVTCNLHHPVYSKQPTESLHKPQTIYTLTYDSPCKHCNSYPQSVAVSQRSCFRYSLYF